MVDHFPLVCSTITAARLDEAHLLGEQLARHHPGERLVVCVVDAPIGAADPEGPFEVIGVDELGLDPPRLGELALCAPGEEFAECLAPLLVSALLATHQRSVVYLAPSVSLLGPLDELSARAVADRVVLVARSYGPMPDDGCAPSEIDRLAAGSYDPDCVALGPQAGPFASWWAQALQRVSVRGEHASTARARALDLVPARFTVETIDLPVYGLSAWNAHERPTRLDATGRLCVGDEAVRTVHLAGFDPGRPSLISAGLSGRARVLLSEHRALADLCRRRAGLIVSSAESSNVHPAQGSRFSHLADGTEVEERLRRIVRGELAADEHTGGAGLLPDPFSAESLPAFYEWLASPDTRDQLEPRLPRYLHAVYGDRADLRWHFPRVGNVDGARFREWVEHHGLDEEVHAVGLRQKIVSSEWWTAPTGVLVTDPEHLLAGVTLVGYLRAEVGLGEAGRLVRDAFERAGIDVRPIIIATADSREEHPVPDATHVADRLVNVVWANADQLPGFGSVVGPGFFAGRYTVGGWVWETERLPDSMARSALLVDEIWAPSRFSWHAIATSVDRPVHLFPHPVVVPVIDPVFDRGGLGLGEGFNFLVMYDFLSSSRRKNPLGAIEAFRRAFRPGEGPVLVLKSINGDRYIDELEQVRLAAAERRDIVVIDRYLTAGGRAALISSCDCFVSLHRAEGFGLVLAEAMALGRPVIATEYSGNLEFMDRETAYLVPAGRVEIGPGASPYEEHDRWADPDLDAAAELMRRVYDDRAGPRRIGEAGRTRVLDEFGLERSARFVATRIAEIERMCHTGYVSGVADALAAWL